MQEYVYNVVCAVFKVYLHFFPPKIDIVIFFFQGTSQKTVFHAIAHLAFLLTDVLVIKIAEEKEELRGQQESEIANMLCNLFSLSGFLFNNKLCRRIVAKDSERFPKLSEQRMSEIRITCVENHVSAL